MNEDIAVAPKAFNDSKVDDIINQDGKIDDQPILDISISDKDLIADMNRKIKDSQDYWNDPTGYNLEYVRNANVRMHMGRQIDRSRLYTYQVPYVDNEIFVGVESVVAYTTASSPQAEVFPATDTPASKILAGDLEKVLTAHGEKFDLPTKLVGAVRNLYLKRLGVLKLVFDPYCGEDGDIVPQVIDPDHIIVDKNAKQGENPAFIAETLKATVEDLINMFPNKKDEIFTSLGIQRGTPKQMGATIAYKEVWFTYWDEGKKCEGLVWFFKDVVLDKKKNPNWLYKDEGVKVSNFLDYPMKPYIFFNYINDGSHLIDLTTPVEQAAPLQDILNKRGRQITENAETANETLVFRGGAITADAAQNLTGDPNQKIILDSKQDPVSSAYGTIPPHFLPNYVIDDKMDLRNTIHNILGTPSQFRGDDGSKQTDTLGEAVMIKNQASGRQDAIVRAIDVGMEKYFKLLTQMMKVHYTEKHYFTINGDDGNFDFIEMSRESIEDRATVNSQSGSTLPYDKGKQEAVAINLAKMNMIDPYNLYRDLHLPNADKRFDAFVKWTMDATALKESVIDDLADRSAYIDYVTIMDGREAKPREDVGDDHILAHRKQMMTDKFLNADVEVQQAFINHVQAEVNSIDQRARLDAASQAGMLTDPNIPVTPEVPELPPPPMGMPGMAPTGGVPQMATPEGQPPMPPQGPPPLDVASVMGAQPPMV